MIHAFQNWAQNLTRRRSGYPAPSVLADQERPWSGNRCLPAFHLMVTSTVSQFVAGSVLG